MKYQCDVCGELEEVDKVVTIQVYGTDTDVCDKCLTKGQENVETKDQGIPKDKPDQIPLRS